MKNFIKYFIGIGAVIIGFNWQKIKRELEYSKREAEKFYDNYQLLSHWLEAKNSGRSSFNYFQEMGYKNIAIYGMGELANRLCEELENTVVKVSYGIDRDVCNTITRMDKVYALDEKLENVDAVVVTPFYAYDSIRNILKDKLNCPIISLEKVIWSL